MQRSNSDPVEMMIPAATNDSVRRDNRWGFTSSMALYLWLYEPILVTGLLRVRQTEVADGWTDLTDVAGNYVGSQSSGYWNRSDPI